MLAFTNTPITKEQFSANIKRHYEADNFIKDTYWENGKGCAVGCQFAELADTDEELHVFGEENTNVPKELYELEDEIFEGLPNELSKEWPIRFDSALKEGKDYTKVWHKFAVWLLVDDGHGIIQYADEEGKKAVRKVAELHKRSANGVNVRQKSWYDAWDATELAATWSVRDATDNAAWASWASRFARAGVWNELEAAGDAAHQRMADKLIELIEEA